MTGINANVVICDGAAGVLLEEAGTRSPEDAADANVTFKKKL